MGTRRLDELDRNFIQNSANDFWQRNVGPVNITTGQLYQSSDRFVNYYAGTVTGTPQIQRSTDVPVNSFARYSSRISSQRNASSNDHIRYQRIESLFARNLSNKIVSFGVDVKADVATSVKLILVSYATPDAGGIGTTFYEETKTILVGAYQRVLFENLSIGNVDNGLGVYVVVTAAIGTDGSAQSTYVTNWKLNIGKKAQEMSYFARDYDGEENICNRYYQRGYHYKGTGVANSATSVEIPIIFHAPMRILPVRGQVSGTVLTSSLDRQGLGTVSPSALSFGGLAPWGFMARFTISGSAVGVPYSMVTDIIQSDAEI